MKNKVVPLTIKINKEIKNKIREKASCQGYTMTTYLKLLINNDLKNEVQNM